MTYMMLITSDDGVPTSGIHQVKMTNMTQANLKKSEQYHQICQHAAELGFVLTGIAAAAPAKRPEVINAWIEAGKHGEMHYLSEHREVRLDPQKMLGGVKSILCVADAYPPKWPSPHDENSNNQANPKRGQIARYAWGSDYHKVLKKRLFKLADLIREQFPEEEFRCTTDTAPLLEREYASEAGLGWIGKHTLLIHPKLGSFHLLGTILTTLELPTSKSLAFPPPTVAPTDHCGTCTRCIDECPTRCIDANGYSMDGSRCISYLTLEHRSEIPVDLQVQMHHWIAGCDVCQEVCPHNREGNHAPLDQILQAYQPKPHLAEGLPLLEILDWSAEDRQQAFMGSAIKRIKLDMIKRNAIIALTNIALEQYQHDQNPTATHQLRERFTKLIENAEEPLVKHTAKQSIQRIDEATQQKTN